MYSFDFSQTPFCFFAVHTSQLSDELKTQECFLLQSDYILDFYNARPIDIIQGADAVRTVRTKVSQKKNQSNYRFDSLVILTVGYQLSNVTR